MFNVKLALVVLTLNVIWTESAEKRLVLKTYKNVNCFCQTPSKCPDEDVLLYGAFGVSVGYLVTQLSPSAVTPTTQLLGGRTTQPSLLLDAESLAKQVGVAIDSFKNAVKRPICAGRYLCRAKAELQQTKSFSSIVTVIANVAGQMLMKDISELSETVFSVLTLSNSANCNWNRHPVCFA